MAKQDWCRTVFFKGKAKAEPWEGCLTCGRLRARPEIGWWQIGQWYICGPCMAAATTCAQTEIALMNEVEADVEALLRRARTRAQRREGTAAPPGEQRTVRPAT